MRNFFTKDKEPELIKKFEVDWENTDVETLTFIHKEASIRVKDTVADHYETSKKAFSILMVIISLTTVIAGTIINHITSSDTHFGLFAVLCVAFLFGVYIIYVLVVLLRPVSFRAPGRVPSKVMVDSKFNHPKVKPDERLKLIVYGELINCEHQITANQHSNTKRLKKVDFILRLIILLLIVLVTMSVIIIAIEY